LGWRASSRCPPTQRLCFNDFRGFSTHAGKAIEPIEVIDAAGYAAQTVTNSHAGKAIEPIEVIDAAGYAAQTVTNSHVVKAIEPIEAIDAAGYAAQTVTAPMQ